MTASALPRIFIDADACPVKEEVYQRGRPLRPEDLRGLQRLDQHPSRPRPSSRWWSTPAPTSPTTGSPSGPGPATSSSPTTSRWPTACLKAGAQALKPNGTPVHPRHHRLGSGLADDRRAPARRWARPPPGRRPSVPSRPLGLPAGPRPRGGRRSGRWRDRHSREELEFRPSSAPAAPAGRTSTKCRPASSCASTP